MDTSLFLAAREGNVKTLQKLLHDDPLLLEHGTVSVAQTPLHVASMLGHLDFAKELIKSKTNNTSYIAELDQHGFSAIHLACANGHQEVVLDLLRVSRDVCNLKGKDGMTPLHIASVKGRVLTIRCILSVSLWLSRASEECLTSGGNLIGYCSIPGVLKSSWWG